MSVETYKISLTPKGSITSPPDSQTLFGSICWSIRELYGEQDLEKLLDYFKDSENKFVISSAFLDGTVKAPMMGWATLDEIIGIGERLALESDEFSTRSRMLKKISYWSESLLRTFLKGELDRKKVVEDLLSEGGRYIYSEGLLAYRDDQSSARESSEENSRRNFINRLSGTTDGGNLFYYNRKFLHPDNKLFFFIKTDNIEYFMPIFRYMSDISIGGDKSIGMNSYDVVYEGEFKYEKRIKENILLSKYIPYYEEVNWPESSFNISMGHYKVESRDEFMGEDILKDEVGYLTEGSKIMLNQNKEIYGQLPVVKEIKGKRIRHNGLGFFL
jgi:CRISPR-associated protein Csm4